MCVIMYDFEDDPSLISMYHRIKALKLIMLLIRVKVSFGNTFNQCFTLVSVLFFLVKNLSQC